MAKTPPIRPVPKAVNVPLKKTAPKPPSPPSDGTATTVSIVMFVALLILGGSIIYYLNSKYTKNFLSTKNTPTDGIALSDDSLALDTPLSEDDAISHEIEQVHPGGSSNAGFVSGNYYLIVATFINQKNAQEYADKLSAQGVSTNVILEDRDRTDFYRVSIAQSQDKEELRNKRLEYISKYNGDAWVLTK